MVDFTVNIGVSPFYEVMWCSILGIEDKFKKSSEMNKNETKHTKSYMIWLK